MQTKRPLLMSIVGAAPIDPQLTVGLLDFGVDPPEKKKRPTTRDGPHTRRPNIASGGPGGYVSTFCSFGAGVFFAHTGPYV